MKKYLIALLCLCLFAAGIPVGAAAEETFGPLSLKYAMRIETASGTAEAKPGEEVTVTFTIRRAPGQSGDFALRILQNEIIYDEDFFAYVPGSATALKSGNALFQTRSDGTHIIKASFLSPNGGAFRDGEDFCSFRLRVVAAEGSGQVRCDPACAKAYDGDNLAAAVRVSDASVTANGPCHPFTDVSKSDWFHEAVDFVWLHGYMNGMGDNRFEPGLTLTRAMAVTMLWRMQGSPAVSAGTAYTDVTPGTWYADAVAWASQTGIVQGYGDGRFGPDDPVTREQLAVILMRFRSENGRKTDRKTPLSAFTDAGEVSPWALDAMEWAVAADLINGRTDTTLVPGGTATRAEVAMLLMRYCRMRE